MSFSLPSVEIECSFSKLKSADKFPQEFSQYIDFLETELNKPISIISVGPDRKQTIFR